MKLYKVKKTAAALAVGLMVATAAPTMAGGIPVYDGAAVAKAVEQVVKMGQQIDMNCPPKVGHIPSNH